MFWIDTPTDGVYAILPAKTRGEGANTFASSMLTTDPSGTVVVEGGAAAVVGIYNGTGAGAVFVPYDDGALTSNSAFINHGKGARLAISVTGTAGSSRVGYAGGAE